jgi:hypothetical protein
LPRLPIDRVNASVIVAETCSGIALQDRVFPSALSLGLSALEGEACAFLSTTKVLRTTGIAAQLATTLLSNGHTLGESARLVNAAHSAMTDDAPSFLLIGDAEAAFRPRDVPGRYLVELPASGIVELPLEPRFEGSLLEVTLTGDTARAWSGTRPFVHVESVVPELPEDAEVFALVTPKADTLLVRLVAARRFLARSLRLRLVAAEPKLEELGQQVARLEHRVSQLSTIARAILQDQPTPPARAACVEQLPILVEHARAFLEQSVALLGVAPIRATSGTTRPLFEVLAERLRDGHAALDGALAQGFPGWGLMHYQVPLYSSQLNQIGAERAAGPCYRCGLPSFELVQRSALRPELARVFTHCPGCDLLFDRLHDEQPVQIHGQNPVDIGSQVSRELRIVNEREEPRIFAAALFVEGDYPWLSLSLEPRVVTLEVPARSIVNVPFRLEVDARSAPGIYRLTAFTCSELSWSLSVEPLVVKRPEAQPISLRRRGGDAGGMQQTE